MSEPIDVTQTPEYMELLQVSEEMEADLMKQLAAKDAIIAEKELQSQAKITQLETDLAGRDKELEEFIAEVEATNNAALQAKDDEAAVLRQALDEARDKRAAAEIQRAAVDASLNVANDRIKQLEAAVKDAEQAAQQKQEEAHAFQLQVQQMNASAAVRVFHFGCHSCVTTKVLQAVGGDAARVAELTQLLSDSRLQVEQQVLEVRLHLHPNEASCPYATARCKKIKRC